MENNRAVLIYGSGSEDYLNDLIEGSPQKFIYGPPFTTEKVREISKNIRNHNNTFYGIDFFLLSLEELRPGGLDPLLKIFEEGINIKHNVYICPRSKDSLPPTLLSRVSLRLVNSPFEKLKSYKHQDLIKSLKENDFISFISKMRDKDLNTKEFLEEIPWKELNLSEEMYEEISPLLGSANPTSKMVVAYLTPLFFNRDLK